MANARRGLCPVLVGRSAESHELTRLARESAADDAPRVVLVAGEAGVGKSRLVGEFLGALEPGTTALRGGADEGDHAVSFAVLRDAVSPSVSTWETFPEPLRDREQALRHLLDPLLPAETPVDLGSDRAGRLGGEILEHAGLRLLRHLLGDGPGVVVMEDLHWADAESVALLHRLASEPDLPVLLVGTFRPEDFERRSPVGQLMGLLERQHRVHHLTVGRLARPEVAEMLEATFGRPVSQRVAMAMHARTQGNPFFVEELLAVAPGDEPEDLLSAELPWNAAEAVLRRVDDLSPDVRRALDAAAILGTRIPFDALERMTEADEADLIDVLRTLVEHGLLQETESDVFTFRHALTREAVASQLLGRQRRRLHEAALDALTAVGSEDHAALAGHARGAGRWDELVHHARTGAERYLSEGASAQAFRLAEEGLGEAPEDLALCATAVSAAWAIGMNVAGLRHAERWRDLAHAQGLVVQEARALRWMSQLRHAEGERDAARTIIATAYELSSTEPESVEHVWVVAACAQLTMLAHRSEEAIALADKALALADARGLDDVRADVLVTKGTALTDIPGHEQEGMAILRQGRQEAERVGNVGALSRALHNILYNLLDRAEAQHAWPVIDEAYTLALRHGLDVVVASVATKGVLFAMQDGDRDQADEWLRRGRRASASGWTGHALDNAAFELRAEDADADLAALLLEEPPDLFDEEDRGWTRAVRALFAALTGDVPTLRELLAEPVRWVSSTHTARYEIEQRTLLAHHAASGGVPPEEVRAFLDAALPEESRTTGFVIVRRAWIEALLAEREGDLDAAEAACQIAVDGVHQRSSKFLSGVTGARRLHELDLLRSRCRAAAGDMEAARRFADRAIARLGRWPGWRRDEAGAYRRRLGGTSGHRDGDALLTPREEEVAVLLTQGLTNRQIAEALYVSIKTAATHVSNILAKTGSATRAEAAAWVVRRDREQENAGHAAPAGRR